MAKRAALLPSWVQTLGAMIDDGARVQASCDTCGAVHRFTQGELAALAARVGRDYSLVDRRTRCRLTPGCAGWNSFQYLHGVYRNLRTAPRLP